MRGRLGGALKFSFAQGLSSLTNYFLSLTLARSLAPAEFGAVSLMLTFAFFAVAAQRAVIGDPALAVGRRAMPMANSMHTILWVFALSASVAIAAAGFVILNWVALVPAAGAFLLVAQDGYRYIAVTKNRLRVVLASDGIWLSLGGAGVGLAVSYSEYGQLGVALWFAGGLLALTFIVAATARSAWPFEGPLYFFRSTRELSGWAALQFGVSNGAIQVTLSVVAVTIGFESFGGFRAIQVVVSPLQVAILALSSPIGPSY